ncbi:uro-adherence factor A-like isoform X2 [Chironomus tepperi]|uniref:uro-adherence factor A-like isoform X2 n=1 Tax=Chironomus tepperi TaxID=113505 RepID=UPI00391FBE47
MDIWLFLCQNDNSASKQPIIISWTNPSTDSTSQLVNIKQEDELHIISQIIQEVPHPASKKSTEIVSPTRVLRSHGKAAVAAVVKQPSKSKRNSKSQPAEVSKKVVYRSSKSMDMSPTNGHNSRWITTVKRKNSKGQAKSNKIQDVKGHLEQKVFKKLVKILPKVDDHEKSIDESLKELTKMVIPKSASKAAQQSKDDLLNEPSKLQNSNSAPKATQMSIESLQEPAKLVNLKSAFKVTQKSVDDTLKEPTKLTKSKSASKATNKPKASKASRKRQLKKDKNGNSLKIDNLSSLASNNMTIPNHSQLSSVQEAAIDIKIDETHIKKEEELDIVMEIDDKSEFTSQIVQKSAISINSQSYLPMEVAVDLKMNEKHIKEEMELDIVMENDVKSELTAESTQIVQKSTIPSLSRSSSAFKDASDLKIDENHIKKEEELDIVMENEIKPELTTDSPQIVQKMMQIEYTGSLAVNNPQNSSESAFLPIEDAATVKVEAAVKDEPIIKVEPTINHEPTIKSEAIDEITVKIIKIDPKTAIKPEPTDLTTSSTSSNLETTSSPLKYFKIESSPSVNNYSAPDVQHDMRFTPLSNFTKIDSKCPEPSKYEDDSDDDDRLIIKEDDVETIDISDTDDEKPDESTPKKFQNSWTNLTNQSLTSTDSNSLTSSNHVSISYPSIDGSTSLQPPVIQFSYQFPMDSQHSASSTQIQKHFMSSAMEPIHKNLGQQSTFGQLFTNGVQSTSKLSVMDRTKLNVE